MRVSCGACGWVTPAHALVPMTWCPCGWRQSVQDQMVEAAYQALRANLSPADVLGIKTPTPTLA